MKVNIYLKHLIIPIIVVGITLISIFASSFILDTNSKFSVTFLYSNNSVSTESPEQLLWNGLKDIQENYESSFVDNNSNFNNIPLFSIDYSRSTSKGDADAKLDLYTSSSNIIIIYGNDYNNTLQSVINRYPTKKFILFYNDESFVGDNVTSVNIDLTDMYKDISKSMQENSETKKLLYISSKEESENEYYLNNFNIEDESYEVYYMHVDNKENYSEISSELNKYLELGIDQVFVDDIEYSVYVIEEIKDYQQHIVDRQIQVNEINEKLETLNNDLENTTDSEEIDLINEEIETLNNELSQETYLQTYLDIYTVGYDYSNLGMYTDVDGTDKSVVKYSYVINSSTIFSQIFDIIISGDKIQSEYTYTYSDIVTRLEGGINE